MSVVDYLLNSIIKSLQKTQKKRKKTKAKKKRLKLKASRKVKKTKSSKKRSIFKRKPAKRAKRVPGRSAKRILKRPLKPKKKKKVARKAVKRPKSKPKKVKKLVKKVQKEKKAPKEDRIGTVTHYFSKIQVIVLKMTNGKLLVGEKIHIAGKTTNFIQKVESLQIESVDVKSAKKGQLVGLKVAKKAKPGDLVFRASK